MMVKKCSLGTLGLLRMSAELIQEHTGARLTMELESERAVYFMSMSLVSTSRQ